MDASELRKRERLKERELWLIVCGALLTGNKGIKEDVLASLDLSDANSEELVGLLTAVKNGYDSKDGNREQVAKCLERFGVEGEVNGKTAIQRITLALQGMVAQRAVKNSAGALNCYQAMETPQIFLATLEREAAVIRAKLKQ